MRCNVWTYGDVCISQRLLISRERLGLSTVRGGEGNKRGVNERGGEGRGIKRRE